MVYENLILNINTLNFEVSYCSLSPIILIQIVIHFIPSRFPQSYPSLVAVETRNDPIL